MSLTALRSLLVPGRTSAPAPITRLSLFPTIGGMDHIELRGMSFHGRHGVRQAERDQTQEFRVDIDVEADLGAAAEALRLGDEVTLDVRHENRGHTGGTRVDVALTDRVERTVPALRQVIEESGAPDRVRAQALEAVDLLAKAEAVVHGVVEERVHLQELG